MLSRAEHHNSYKHQRVSLPSQTMSGLLHRPSAPHTELLSPLLHTKPSSQMNVATLLYVVPVTGTSTVSSSSAGGPQLTTEQDRIIHNLGLHPAFLYSNWLHGFNSRLTVIV